MEYCRVCGCDIPEDSNFILEYEGEKIRVHSQACVTIGVKQIDYNERKDL